MDKKLNVKNMPSDVLLNKFLTGYIFKDCKLEEYQELLNEVKRRLDCWQNLKDFLEDEVKKNQELYQKSLKEE